MFYVYILKSVKTNEFYKGQTNNLERRLKEHFEGRVNITKNKLPWILVHVELCESRVKASKLEIYFKSGIGREILKELF